MDFLVELFHSAVTYPNLNVLFWLDGFTHSFALAIVLFSGAANILFAWPAALLDEITRRRQHEAHPGVPRAVIALRLWRYPAKRTALIRLTTAILSLLKLYTTFGIYFVLAALAGRPVEAVNAVLYPAIPHLTALPGYDVAIGGQTISLTQHAVPWPLLFPAVAAMMLVQAAFKARYIARLAGKGSFWSRLAPIFIADYAVNLLIILALSRLFAAGAVLAWMTDTLLWIPLRIYLMERLWRGH
jgi:hypothetical protein